jgi:hypothetical protein
MGDDIKRTEVENKDWILARLLFEKFSILHDFHQIQMKTYIVACCNISLGGVAKLSVADKTITYELATERKFKKTDNELVEKNKFIGLWSVPPVRYKVEKALAYDNLVKWTRQLLWNDTNVILVVDGKSYAG